MGRKNRERIELIRQGKEQPIAQSKRILNSSIGRGAVKLASRKGVVDELSRASIWDQIEVLGSIPPSKVGKAIMQKAPGEMDKGIRKFQQQGKKVTVEGLLEEVRTTPGFLAMCENAGIPYAWFQELARERMKRHGIKEG